MTRTVRKLDPNHMTTKLVSLAPRLEFSHHPRRFVRNPQLSLNDNFATTDIDNIRHRHHVSQKVRGYEEVTMSHRFGTNTQQHHVTVRWLSCQESVPPDTEERSRYEQSHTLSSINWPGSEAETHKRSSVFGSTCCTSRISLPTRLC